MNGKLPLGWAATALLAAPLGAQSITTLYRTGDAIPGVGDVEGIRSVEVNSAGSWFVTVDTDFPLTGSDDVVMRDGAVLYREGDAATDPPGVTWSASETYSLGDDGSWSAYRLLLGSPLAANAALYYDDQVVIRKGDPVGAFGVTAGTTYTAFGFETWRGAPERFLCLAEFDDPAIPGTDDEALVFVALSGGGHLELLFEAEGDALPGQSEAIAGFPNNRSGYDLSTSGTYAFLVELEGDDATDTALYRSGELLAQEGSPSGFVPGADWADLADAHVDLNGYGQAAFAAGIVTGAPDDDELVVHDGRVVARAGDPIPALPGATFTSFRGIAPVFLSEQGEVLFYAGIQYAPSVFGAGLFLGHELLVEEGVTAVGADTIADVPALDRTYRLSDDGRYLIFEAQLVSGDEGAFLLDRGPRPTSFCVGDGSYDPGGGPVACPCSNEAFPGEGGGCQNSLLRSALLQAAGSLDVAEGDTTFRVSRARPGQPGMLLQGASQVALPFRDGILCMGPPTERIEVVFTDANGAAETSSDVAAEGGATPGQTLYYQLWYRDPVTSPCGTGSNFTQGLALTWQ